MTAGLLGSGPATFSHEGGHSWIGIYPKPSPNPAGWEGTLIGVVFSPGHLKNHRLDGVPA